MNFRKLVAISTCGACLVFTGLASAQQAQTRAQAPQAQPKAGQAAQPAQWQTADQQLATCVAIANQTEIAIAKRAQEKAKNKDVKEFASMLVKDHQDFLQKLKKFAPEASQEGFLNERTDSNADDRRTSARVQPAGGEVKNAKGEIQQTAGTRAGAEAGQPLDMIQLHREIAEECIRSAKRGMDKKDGKEFDECFVGFQIAAHAQMKDKLIVFQRHASGELNQVLAEGLDATEKHLKKAENLMKDLAGSDKSNSTAKRDKD